MKHFYYQIIRSSVGLAFGLFLTLLLAPASYAQVEARLVPDGGLATGFGSDVSMEGDRMLVGAEGEEINGPSSGAAYIFERQAGGSWSQVAKLVASDVATNYRFGRSVSLSIDRALIGAPGANAAYIFERQANGQWIEQARLVANDGGGSRFGYAGAISGDVVLVGTYNGAYIFERQNDGAWLETAKLASDVLNNFGETLDVDGHIAVVSNQVETSIAHVYERQADGTWPEVAKLPPVPPIHSPFANTAAIWNERIYVSTQHSDPAFPEHTGSGYVYERQGGAWPHVATLNASTQRGFQFFGWLGDVYGDRILANGWDGPLMYERQSDGSWFERALLRVSDQYLSNPSISGDRAALPGGDGVYVFDLTQIPHEVYDFTLIDPSTDQPVRGFESIPEGTVFNIKQMSRFQNIRANVSGYIKEVRFSYESNDAFHIEGVPPYALFGDEAGDYANGRFQLGAKTLTAIPYDAAGNEGKSHTLTFIVVQEDPGLVIDKLYVLNADTDFIMGELGTFQFNPSDSPRLLTMRADVLGPAESVRFTLDPLGHTQIENEPPYALFGDVNGDYAGVDLQPGTYTVTATAFRQNNARGSHGPTLSATFTIPDMATGSIQSEVVEAPSGETVTGLPATYELFPAFPNPFNPAATIRFSLPEQAPVRLSVYDILGREVQLLVDGVREAGHHEVNFEASNLPSGTYLYRLETPEISFTQKMLLLK